MNLSEVLASASDAWALVAAHPMRWAAVLVIFLVAVESLTLVPYVGFVLKLSVAGIVVPQLIALFAEAAAGRPPSPTGLAGALSFSPSTMAVLVGAALLPFAAGILFLYAKDGLDGIQFFFGNMFRLKPPPAERMEQFKYVTTVVAIPFTLLAGAVVLQHLSGLAALTAALSAAVVHWLPVLVLSVLGLAFEWASVQLATSLPKPAAVVVGIGLLLAYLAFALAMTYTVSAKVYGLGGAKAP